MSEIRVVIPISLPSLSNCRLHWAALARLKKQQAQTVAVALYGVPLPPLPVVVTLRRIGKRRLDGHDNLRSSGKAVIDQIAKAYQTDDASPLFEWVYEQGTAREPRVEIEIKERT